MKKNIFIICVISFVLFSCIFDFDYMILGENEFWGQNLKTNRNYKLEAHVLYEGEYCNVRVEKKGNKYSASKDAAKKIGEAFDNEIYPAMMEAFGNDFTYEGEIYNTMEAADFLMGDQDGKLCILLLDIIDGYTPGNKYVGGYFYPLNFKNVAYSNNRDMIYIDTYPLLDQGFETVLGIIAHELQHLMNFVTRTVDNKPEMDLWINEGLSSIAERMFDSNDIRLVQYKENTGGTIDKGNNFFVWGGNDKKNEKYDKEIYKNAILDEYSTVYMFFQWLRLHSSEDIAVFKKFVKSEYSNFRAVTSNIDGYGVNDWGNLIRDWYTALYVNNPDGIYGYKGEAAFNDIIKHYIDSTDTKVNLFPGEGVFSYTLSSYTIPVSGIYNKYAGMGTGVSPIINTGNIPAGSALLTYNSNSNNTEGIVTASITGKTPPPKPPTASVTSGARSVFTDSKGPYPISMEEMLRLNGVQNGAK